MGVTMTGKIHGTATLFVGVTITVKVGVTMTDKIHGTATLFVGVTITVLGSTVTLTYFK
jgi:hypothetical protein